MRRRAGPRTDGANALTTTRFKVANIWWTIEQFSMVPSSQKLHGPKGEYCTAHRTFARVHCAITFLAHLVVC